MKASVYDVKMTLFTARKRSFGHGNIFRSVCHSVNRGVSVWCHFLSGSHVHSGGFCLWSHVPSRRSLFRGISVQGGLCSEEQTQWRIQDFPEGGVPTPKILLFCKNFVENCMKMKEFGASLRSDKGLCPEDFCKEPPPPSESVRILLESFLVINVKFLNAAKFVKRLA